MSKLVGIVACAFVFAAAPALAQECTNITVDEVKAAQQQWGDGIVAIGKADDAQAAAKKHVDTLYAYDLGEVLFKPTKASEVQFRDTAEEAESYFVTGVVPEDHGFALAPYTKVRFENDGIITDCDSALAMGNYFFTGKDGKEAKVEFSFGYVKDKDGHLKINLHHSSFPYQKK